MCDKPSRERRVFDGVVEKEPKLPLPRRSLEKNQGEEKKAPPILGESPMLGR